MIILYDTVRDEFCTKQAYVSKEWGQPGAKPYKVCERSLPSLRDIAINNSAMLSRVDGDIAVYFHVCRHTPEGLVPIMALPGARLNPWKAGPVPGPYQKKKKAVRQLNEMRAWLL